MESAIFGWVMGLLVGAAGMIVTAALAYERGRRAGLNELLTRDDGAVIEASLARRTREHEEIRRVPRYPAIAVLLAVGCAWPSPADALQINATCFTEEQRDRTLKEKYLETLVGNAAVTGNHGRATGIAELWTARETTTIMLVLPGDRHCVVFVGGPWRWVAPEQGELTERRIAE